MPDATPKIAPRNIAAIEKFLVDEMLQQRSYTACDSMNSAGAGKKRVSAWLVPLALFLFALVVRLLYFYWDPEGSRDGIYYIKALELLNALGNTEADYQPWGHIPPLFLLCGKGFMQCGLSARTSLLLLNFFCGCAFPVLLYYIIRHYAAEDEIALGIAILIAIFPPLVKNSVDLLREPLYFFLAAAAFALEIYAFRPTRSISLLAGWCSGFLAAGCGFVRAEGTLAALLLFGYWLYASHIARKWLPGIAVWLAGMASMVLLLWSFFPSFMLTCFLSERINYWFSTL